MEPKFPHIKVTLVGADGNAFCILGKMQRELRKAKVSPDDVRLFMKEAMSGDYDHLLQTCMKWVDVA